LSRDIGPSGNRQSVDSAVFAAHRQLPRRTRPVVRFDSKNGLRPFSVRHALAGKNILLIGVTGFIAKVWLIQLLTDLPEIGKIYLLIRRQGPNRALRRFEKIVEESPVFDALHERYGADLPRYLSERIEVIEGDVSQPNLV